VSIEPKVSSPDDAASNIENAGTRPPFGTSWRPIYAGVIGLLLMEIALFWVVTQVYA
jgi:hypothetical protein